MSERLFGTNGVRGVINKDMNSAFAMQMGKAIGTVYKRVVAIGTDTRVSADMIKTAVSSGLMSVGVTVIDLGMLPTPAIQYYVKTHDNVLGGVMITASHNPPAFNGIKCISRDGTEASRVEEIAIEDAFATEIKTVEWDKVGRFEKITTASDAYIDAIISHVDVEKIRKAKLKVCIDCANGASVHTSPLLLKKLNVKAITINGNPQGEFPGHPSEPIEDNLKDLMSLTKSSKSDLGIAHDGDADRCVFVSGDGKYVSGDKSLSLIAKYILSKKKGKVVTPVSSSSMVEEVVTEAGGVIKYTAVGSPTVARKMMEYEAVFGGEENGGLIFPDQQYCRDGGMAIAMMLECVAINGSLASQVSKLPVYYTEKIKIECPNESKKKLLEHMEKSSEGAKIDRTDGLKLIYEDGWVLMRPSGTEPLFRIYSESKDQKISKDRAEKFEEIATGFLGIEAVQPVKKTTHRKKSTV